MKKWKASSTTIANALYRVDFQALAVNHSLGNGLKHYIIIYSSCNITDGF